jgi:hypothetical protein
MLVLNNKSNLCKTEFIKYQKELEKFKIKDQEVILCPADINIALFNLSNIILGAQNVSSYNEGPHTGEISSKMLKSYGVEYSLVGHSERRREQKEKDIDVQSKIQALLQVGIKPILCIGETKEERKSGKVLEKIAEELSVAFEDLTKEEIDGIVIAYEPLYAIGTGVVPSLKEIEEVLSFVKEKYKENKLLYGGSVNLDTFKKLKNSSLIDGYLLGSLSLKVGELKEFIKKI